MDYLLWRRVEYEELYNCTFYDINQIPKAERLHPYIGASFILLFAIFEACYIPSLIVVRSHQFYTQPVYKLMFFIGLTDIGCLWVNALATGIFLIQGYVFCSAPLLMHILGAFAMFCWIAESDLGMILAFNRALEMYNTHVCASAFEGKRVYLWLLIPTVHGISAAFFSKAVSFNSVLLSWFFSPHLAYHNDDPLRYANWVHTINNITVLVVLSLCYSIFVILLLRKANGLKHFEAQKSALIQVFSICTVTFIAAGIYTYEQFFPVSTSYILMGSYAWVCAHGCPSIVYVTVNKTVRKEQIQRFHGQVLSEAKKLEEAVKAEEPSMSPEEKAFVEKANAINANMGITYAENSKQIQDLIASASPEMKAKMQGDIKKLIDAAQNQQQLRQQ